MSMEMPSGITPQKDDKQRDEKFAGQAQETLLEAKKAGTEGDISSAAYKTLAAWDLFKQAYKGSVPVDKATEFEGIVRKEIAGSTGQGHLVLKMFQNERQRNEGLIVEANKHLIETKSLVEQGTWHQAGDKAARAYVSLNDAYSKQIHRYGRRKFANVLENINSKNGTDAANERLNKIIQRIFDLAEKTDVTRTENGEAVLEDMVSGLLRRAYATWDPANAQGAGAATQAVWGGMISEQRLNALEVDLPKNNSPEWLKDFRALRADIGNLDKRNR